MGRSPPNLRTGKLDVGFSSTATAGGNDYWKEIWRRPGIRGLSVFVALAVTGFLIWELQPTRYVFEAVGLDYANPDFFCLRLLSEPLLRCVLALAAGLFFPRGFYLWGLALAIHTTYARTPR